MISAPLAPSPLPEQVQNRSSLFENSTPLLDDAVALRARAERDGYLFFKGFLPVEPLRELRRQMLTICEERGWLAKGRDLMDGIVDEEAINRVPDAEMRSDIGVTEEAYKAVQKLELFHSIPHHPNFLKLYGSLFGSDAMPHPRHIARMISPHRVMIPTPEHQDYTHIQGARQTWTCWFPVGNCPREMGSLTVLRGSHRNGVVPVKPAGGAGGLASLLCPNEIDWVEGDFEMGDILTFTSCTVHRALRSKMRDRIRLSCDIRFQAAKDEIHEASLNPHIGCTWDELYEGWKNPDVQYYWKKHELKMAEWDPSLHWQKERICS